jgi:Asp-tRNA(Asn)/Glu-tRNA(Gln) amidotransferase A subunit family amidase
MTDTTVRVCTTITDAAEALRNGAVTATGSVENAIAAADADDEWIGVFLARFVEHARWPTFSTELRTPATRTRAAVTR